MDNGLADQEREIKGLLEIQLTSKEWLIKLAQDVIRRAKGNPDKTGSFRRDTLKRLIDTIHSPYPNLKILAAQNIRFFFTDFPELEEAAINAIYDLCEDQSSKVRIEGYTAITQISRADNKSVKRNADVLVQLLQSDEPDEVTVVKKQLTEHLDMDPKVTLGVLCDQISPPDESMDDEEQAIRDRLRSLVLSFLTGEARRAIVERHAVPSSVAEEVLINRLLSAIPKLHFDDVQTIVNGVLLSLTAYKTRSRHGPLLLEILLNKTSTSLRTGVRSADDTLLHTPRLYLDLIASVVVERQAAPAIQLLRFYCSYLCSKITLQKFSPEDQVSVICNMVETFDAASQAIEPRDDEPQLDLLRKQVMDASPFLLESLGKALNDDRSAKASILLLHACMQRKEETNWTLPPSLVETLRHIQTNAAADQGQPIQSLIRSLLSSTTNHVPLQDSTMAGIPKNSTRLLANDKGLSRSSSLPERPPMAPPPRRIMVPHKSQPHNPVMVDPSTRQTASTSTWTTNKHDISMDNSPRPSKRLKDNEKMDAPGPSLLSRLTSNGSGSRADPAKRSLSSHAPETSAESPRPSGGWSIKGAAKMAARTPSSPDRTTNPPQKFSLLDRLEGGSPAPSSGAFGGRKKKNWV